MEVLDIENRKLTYSAPSGARYFYLKDSIYFFYYFSLKDPIKADLLREATDAMMQRCPYFHTKPVFEGPNYLLVESDDSLPVLQNEGYVLTEDPRSRGFLFTISYNESTIYFCFHHALTDASGSIRFTCSLVAEYLRRAYRTELFIPDELRPGTPTEEAEFADPYQLIRHVEHPFSFHHDAGFSFPQEDVSESSRRIQFHVPIDSILKLSKNAESSFSSVLAMILSVAINKIYPVENIPILIKCSTDTRTLLGCPKTLQNCHSGILYVYSNRLCAMPFEQQLSCFKGMMMLQTSEEYLMNILEKKKLKHESVCSSSYSIEDIRARYSVNRQTTPQLSYVKSIDFGDIASYLKDFGIDSSIKGTAGIFMIAYCVGSECIVTIRTNLKSNACDKAIFEVLEELSIPYCITHKEGYEYETE